MQLNEKKVFVLEFIQEWIYKFYEYLQSSYQGLNLKKDDCHDKAPALTRVTRILKATFRRHNGS